MDKVHFMGIGGSGMNAAAILTKKEGYKVDGCDLEQGTDYLAKVKDSGINVLVGHSPNHIDSKTILVVSPAILYLNKDHPECVKARKMNNIYTWHKFLGDHVLKSKEVIGITGTHGKSTTTAMVGKMLEDAKSDPSVLVGAKVGMWDGNLRIGKSKYFVIEADDFYEKFLDYNLKYVILNNIEFDHPDFFKNELAMIKSYLKLMKVIPDDGLVIYNKDSLLVRKMLKKLGKTKYECIGYATKSTSDYKISIDKRTKTLTQFLLTDINQRTSSKYTITVPGDYNVENATGAIIIGKKLGIPVNTIRRSIKSFSGIGRRLELIGKKKGVVVYDDYAHHPTAIKVTLAGLRQKYPKNKILVINEPHSYSRTKCLLSNYKGAFNDADEVIIAPIYIARDKKTFGVNEKSVIKASKHKNVKYLGDFDRITNYITKNVSKGDVLVIMGAGKSYHLTKQIYDKL